MGYSRSPGSHPPWSPGYPSKLLSMAPFFFLLLFGQILLCAAVDTINSTTPLTGTQKIVSQGNKFTLGFYSPSSSGNYYIAIWYSSIPTLTTVWTATTDVPVSDPSTVSLEIASDGNLVLLDQAKNRRLWSTNISIPSNHSTIAIIRDNGSLDLADASNSSKYYWRSIDNPTNTWLPGGKVGLNKVTGQSHRLIPWKNNADPSPGGLFSLELDPNGTTQYFIQWNKSISYWTSGPWNGNTFSLVPEMTKGYNYDFRFIDTATERYFFYYMKDDSVLSRLVMDVNGQIKQWTWVEYSQQWILFWSQPRSQCEVYALCGAYGSCSENALPFCNCIKGYSQKVKSDWDLQDYSGGCKRNVLLQCQTNSRQTKPDKFYPMAGVRLPENAQSAAGTSSEECEVACLKNCSCSAYTYNTSGCFVWPGELVNLQEQYSGNGVGTLFLRLAASELPDSEKSKAAIIGAVVGGVAAVLVVLGILFFFLFQKHRRDRTLRVSKTAGGTLIAFRYSDLQHVTSNFSEKLGGGAFGSVFRGKLPDSTVIAVKRLDGFHQGEKQFRAEVSTIGTTQHVNLVRLLGFCSEGSRRLLVYEFMPKGSLEVQLFPGETTALSWATRYQIALGTARGLNYLHEKCRDCIIHCDVKPDNILLDESFVPKVSDFGLAKLLGRDFSRVLTTMRGTRGYLAPEWISGVPITAKADVFSYGMMLFEIISGRRNADHGDDTFFPTLAASKLHEGDVQTLLDPRLKGDASPDELTRACKVACWCIQDDESTRPTTGQIVQILEGLLDVNMPPVPRSLTVLGESPNVINFFSDLSSSQTSRTQNSTTTSSQTSQTQNSTTASQAHTATSSTSQL